MQGALDLGEVILPRWSDYVSGSQENTFSRLESELGAKDAHAMHDLSYVRTRVRKRLEGRTEAVDHCMVSVLWPTGEVEEWVFDRQVGWPVVNGEARDFKAEMMQRFGGTA